MATGEQIGDEWLPGEVATSNGSGHVTAIGSGDAISVPVGSSIAQAERQLILATFAHCGRNKERTAAVLGVSLKTLYNRLKEFSSESAVDGEAAPH